MKLGKSPTNESATMADKNSGGVWETVKTVVYAVAVALVLRTVAFEPFNIPSGSMLPTLLVGDYLFVSKYSYGYSRHSLPMSPNVFDGRVMFTPPERGDVAVFKLPSRPSIDYIKRIVGLPGDRIQVKGGILHINGEAVRRERVEDFEHRDPGGNVIRATQYLETLPGGVSHLIIETGGDTWPTDNTPVYVVPPGHFFVMGDNRDNSQDSRFLDVVGFVPFENLVGRAEFLFFSTDGSAALWQIWQWPFAVRWSRLFDGVG